MSIEIYHSLYQSMKSLSLHLDDGERSLFSRFGLTTSRFYILKHINNHPGISYIVLSELMLCTKGNISRIVQGMLEDCLINRLENPRDRRSFQLFLTKTGESLFEEVNAAYQDYILSLLSKMNEDQLETFAEATSSIENRLSNAVGN
jgi:DNA-binding MarR family transcriptional regulator